MTTLERRVWEDTTGRPDPCGRITALPLDDYAHLPRTPFFSLLFEPVRWHQSAWRLLDSLRGKQRDRAAFEGLPRDSGSVLIGQLVNWSVGQSRPIQNPRINVRSSKPSEPEGGVENQPA